MNPPELHERAQLAGAGMHDTDLRVMVSPGYGTFTAQAPDGTIVQTGQVVARVESSSKSIDLVAPCDCRVASLLAEDGDRVQPGRPLVHLEAL